MGFLIRIIILVFVWLFMYSIGYLGSRVFLKKKEGTDNNEKKDN